MVLFIASIDDQLAIFDTFATSKVTQPTILAVSFLAENQYRLPKCKKNLYLLS